MSPLGEQGHAQSPNRGLKPRFGTWFNLTPQAQVNRVGKRRSLKILLNWPGLSSGRRRRRRNHPYQSVPVRHRNRYLRQYKTMLNPAVNTYF